MLYLQTFALIDHLFVKKKEKKKIHLQSTHSQSLNNFTQHENKLKS